MGEPKAFFGAIPDRAFADRELHEIDMKVLGVVASHDNMSLAKGKGKGAYPLVSTIANKIGFNPNNVSSSLTKLIDRDYLMRDVHPTDRRQSVFRVIYDKEKDKAAFKGKSVSPVGEISGRRRPTSNEPDRVPDDAQVSRPVDEVSRPNGESVSPGFPNQPQKSAIPDGNIPIENKPENIPSDESAPHKTPRTLTGQLSIAERRAKAGEWISENDKQHLWNIATGFRDDAEEADIQIASRILDTYFPDYRPPDE